MDNYNEIADRQLARLEAEYQATIQASERAPELNGHSMNGTEEQRGAGVIRNGVDALTRRNVGDGFFDQPFPADMVAPEQRDCDSDEGIVGLGEDHDRLVQELSLHYAEDHDRFDDVVGEFRLGAPRDDYDTCDDALDAFHMGAPLRREDGEELEVGAGGGYEPLVFTDSEAEEEDPTQPAHTSSPCHVGARNGLPEWEAVFPEPSNDLTEDEVKLIKDTMRRVQPKYAPRWAASLTDAQLLGMLQRQA